MGELLISLINTLQICSIFRFFGILFVNECFGLKKGRADNSLAGAYFTGVGTYNFVDTRDDTFLTSYDLTSLENSLGNAKRNHNTTLLDETAKLESNLNAIYRVCGKNRANYLPYGTFGIPENYLKDKVDKALSDSDEILADLVALSSKNYTDKFGTKDKMNTTGKPKSHNYLYPKYVNDYEVAKKYINFTFGLEKISTNSVVINVKMALPYLVRTELHRVQYVPTYNIEKQVVEHLRDQSISNFGVQKDINGYSSNQGFFIIKNMNNCLLVNETLLCDPALTTAVKYNYQTCISSLFGSNCNSEYSSDCPKVHGTCVYEQPMTRYKEFTYLESNKFFALFTREANYIYKCEGGMDEKGVLVFSYYGDHMHTGTVEVDENCSLITAYTTVWNRNGGYEIQDIENADMIWADLPKIIGIPERTFIISAAVAILIVILLLIMWICICVKRCKYKKVQQQNTEEALE